MKLHVYMMATDNFQVWADKEADQDGICVGAAESEDEAVQDALVQLRAWVFELEQRGQFTTREIIAK